MPLNVVRPGLLSGYLTRDAPIAEIFSQVFFAPWDITAFIIADGALHHLGRVDDQVKVNGVRTELGDISSTALRCSGVEYAASVACQDASNATRIVLFVSPELSPEDLMSELSQYLPGVYMPSFAIALPRLPSLENGKLDRKLLEAIARYQMRKPSCQDTGHAT